MTNLPDFLGPYRLARFIRSGNACQIWEAIESDGKTRCVLKVLRREKWGNREEANLLKHEYEVAHKVKHPNVIRIYDFRIEGKIPFLVLEIFSVSNLKQALRANADRLIYHFVPVVEQCAAALGALHGKGWVHCDVKPDNFLINDDEKIKLIDFTIAQRAAKGPIGRLLARRGKVQGTRSYMSPEQIRNKALDARADIYSLGCMMYELLTGKVPYTGASPDELLNKHLRFAVPSVLVHNPNVTDELAELIRRMMAKTPDERPASMEEVLKELRGVKPFKTAPKLPENVADQTEEGAEPNE